VYFCVHECVCVYMYMCVLAHIMDLYIDYVYIYTHTYILNIELFKIQVNLCN
jgi:hypothetical protein